MCHHCRVFSMLCRVFHSHCRVSFASHSHSTQMSLTILDFFLVSLLCFVVWKKALVLLSLLHQYATGYTPAAVDKDLLLDASLLVWKVSCDVFSTVIFQDQSACKQLLDNPEVRNFLWFLMLIMLN